MFGKGKNTGGNSSGSNSNNNSNTGKAKWKVEYEDTVYKIYDWDKNLAGYFFPEYGDVEPVEKEDEIIEEMNSTHAEVPEGTLMLPMLKLSLLDNQEAMDVDYVLAALEVNKERAGVWKKWLGENAAAFSVFGAGAHTAREDRNMLSIALGVSGKIKLGEKEVRDFLAPLLDRLHQDGLL